MEETSATMRQRSFDSERNPDENAENASIKHLQKVYSKIVYLS